MLLPEPLPPTTATLAPRRIVKLTRSRFLCSPVYEKLTSVNASESLMLASAAAPGLSATCGLVSSSSWMRLTPPAASSSGGMTRVSEVT